ncbi:glycosyl hydrolase family 18 protein [Legionella cincinnatiensis]|uniref:chitinase n=1 Tax=Legionella cincinnatiensis TaxID=28085 RepID=A0A378IJQ9_9GAMM|nr:glycosyl hydrolase family 18 protein [Legionella cincinnatiensis]KTC81931.1 Glycosyl hydrolases family 18 [Legionella cincinnatiensis]STX34711.1 Chitinase [Legionella cincinnatiensis]
MNKLMIKVLPVFLLDFTLVFIPTNASAQNTHVATQNAQKKEIQQAEKFAERLSSQTTVPLKYNMVGYLESWGKISIEEAIANNYNVIVIAFGTIDGDKVGMNLNCGPTMPDGCFLPSVQWWPEPPEWIPNFTNSVAFAHSKGVKVLLSFGGANNTFKPGTTNSTTLAQSIVHYLENLNLDGIDFDLEHISTTDFPGNSTERQQYLSALIKQIKLLNNKLIITSAPQINPVQDSSGTAIQFVNTGSETVYNDAISNNLFDYIFAQAYNTPGFTVNNQCAVQWQNVGDETYPTFISKIAPCLEKLLPKDSKTKIMIGEPANSSESAGHGALEHGTYNEIANEYQNIKGLSSFGGTMTWSINEDSKASDDKGPRIPYSFSSALVPILSN